MKIKSFIVLSVFALSALLVSCGSSANNEKDQQVAELQSQVAALQQQVGNQQGQNQVQQQNQIPQTQVNVQNQQYNQQGNGQGQQQNNQQGQQQNSQFGNTNANVSIDQAKQIATSNAGFDVNSVTYIKTIQDYDDGFLKWEIDFVANNVKYEYDISASNGTILKAEREGVAYGGYIPPANNNQQGNQGNIGGQQNSVGQGNIGGQGIDVENAKSIAVQHAGFNISNVTFVKQKYDFDDGLAKWEIEFVNGTNKYEYEVSASNGSILKFQVESIYND